MTEEMLERHRAWRAWYEEQLRQDAEAGEDCIKMQPCECPEREKAA